MANVQIAGKKETTENLNITNDGKLVMEGLKGSETLIANISSYIKDCKITYNDVNNKDNAKPQCCLSYKTSNDQTEQICAINDKFCVYDTLAMIKKMKIACNKTAIKPLDKNLTLNNLLAYTEFQFASSFKF